MIEYTLKFFQSEQVQLPSGNFPKQLGKSDDFKVNFCHGAAGAVSLFLEAYKIFNDKSYLDTAIECGMVIWNRGI